MKTRSITLLAPLIFATTLHAQEREIDWSVPHRADRLIVVPKSDANDQQVADWHSKQAAKRLKTFIGPHRTQLLETGQGQTLEQIAASYQASGLFEVVEPDYFYTASVLPEPDDPAYEDGDLWALNNSGQNGGLIDADIDAPEAWETIVSAEPVIVGVVDTGVRYTHEDLAANMWMNPAEVPGNGIDDDNNGIVDDVHGYNAVDDSGDPLDDSGHGTHISGTIAAVGSNGVGSVGVAWKAQIMALKFLDAEGAGATSDAIECLDYAREHGATVINASWGGPGKSAALEAAIEMLAEDGIILVAAAGNEAQNLDGRSKSYPSSFTTENILSVAATTRVDALANYSNYGEESVDLAAPGSAIFSTWHESDRAYQTISGTSMAAPHVAGAVALLRALYPSAPYDDLIDTLLKSTDPIETLDAITVTGGRLNIGNAVNQSATQLAASAVLSITHDLETDEILVTLQAIPGVAYTLQASSNLTDWEAIATEVTDPSGRGITMFLPTQGSRTFFRATISE